MNTTNNQAATEASIEAANAEALKQGAVIADLAMNMTGSGAMKDLEQKGLKLRTLLGFKDQSADVSNTDKSETVTLTKKELEDGIRTIVLSYLFGTITNMAYFQTRDAASTSKYAALELLSAGDFKAMDAAMRATAAEREEAFCDLKAYTEAVYQRADALLAEPGLERMFAGIQEQSWSLIPGSLPVGRKFDLFEGKDSRAWAREVLGATKEVALASNEFMRQGMAKNDKIWAEEKA